MVRADGVCATYIKRRGGEQTERTPMDSTIHFYITDNSTVPCEEYLSPIGLYDWECHSPLNIKMAQSILATRDALGFPHCIVYHVA